MKLKKGGIETVIVAVVLIGIVIGLIATVVKDMSNAGEKAIRDGVDNLAGNQVTMQE